jgi:hypothetical protein
MLLAHDPHDPPHPRARSACDGPLTAWVRSLDAERKVSLFQRLVRADVALSHAFPAYAEVRRVQRVCFLLLCEAASIRGLHPSELVMLSCDPQGDALRALAVISRLGVRDENSSRRA